jgi:NAD(P)-dependent dehydrogenase (short-subunit alcohol dehydrogenase family)
MVAADITASTGNAGVHVAPLDLADRRSVGAFLAGWRGPLHVLVNNAGVMACPETRTPEGWELQFATNHLGHFALATGLHRALADGAAATGEARVVAVSSSALFRSPVIFDDLHFEWRPYDPWEAYGQSKTANVLFAVGATARWASEGITSNALMPGAIRTNLQRHVGGIRSQRHLWKTTEQGASTSVLLATSPLLKGIGGRYFADNQEALVMTEAPEDLTGVAAHALDPEAADRLWLASAQLLS